jgi:hypothetical protein
MLQGHEKRLGRRTCWLKLFLQPFVRLTTNTTLGMKSRAAGLEATQC